MSGTQNNVFLKHRINHFLFSLKLRGAYEILGLFHVAFWMLQSEQKQLNVFWDKFLLHRCFLLLLSWMHDNENVAVTAQQHMEISTSR